MTRVARDAARAGGRRARVAYLGPPGTFSEEALRAVPGADAYEPMPLTTVRETVLAVQDGLAARGLAPIENSLEGAVNVTLDTLAFDAEDVRIAGEVVLPVRHVLFGGDGAALADIRAVLSHPQATAQCARWLREHLPGARILTTSSTADAVRAVAEGGDRDVAAIGTRIAGELYGGRLLAEGIEDAPDNTTRFVWLAPAGEHQGASGGTNAPPGSGTPPSTTAPPGAAAPPGATASPGTTVPARAPHAAASPLKTSLVFWGAGTDAPGWLVRCLSEFAFRGVNLTRIESRPRKRALGEYVFFVDLDGGDTEPPVAEAVDALRRHTEVVRVLGSYAAAQPVA